MLVFPLCVFGVMIDWLKFMVVAQPFFHFFGVVSLIVVGALLPVVAGEAVCLFVIPFLGCAEEVAGFVGLVVVWTNHGFLMVVGKLVFQAELFRQKGGERAAVCCAEA